MKNRIASALFALALSVSASGCASIFGVETESPAEDLAVAELTFQGVQSTIQSLANSGVITPEIAPCVSDANRGLHAGLEQSRIAVRMGLGSATATVSAFRAALLDMRDVITRIKAGDYVCLSSGS